ELAAEPVADPRVAVHAAHHHQVHVRVALAHRLAEAEAVHPRHEQIGDDELRLLLVEQAEPLLAVARLHHPQRVLREVLVDDPLEQRPGVLVVVDDEDRGHAPRSYTTWQEEGCPGEISPRAGGTVKHSLGLSFTWQRG